MARLLTVIAAFALPLLFISVSALVAAAPIPDAAKGPVLYFPTKVGARWTYRFPHGDEVRVVTAVDKKGDARVVSVGRVRDDKRVTPHSKVEVSPRGLYQLGTAVALVRVRPEGDQPLADDWHDRPTPLCLLKFPTAPGDRWEGMLAEVLPATCTVGREEVVKVPAGEFRATPVETALGRLRVRTWYAPSVGPVKCTTTDRREVVLAAFSPGRD